MNRLILAALVMGMTLAGCGPRKVAHHGYAADGYGVIDNSPHLPPPDTLWQHAAPAH
ncbi:hypothetical protein ACFFGF_02805 [Asaia lannensis]|uniref:Lipoprotein n=1 Tax=Asaia lannensis NBRC 102526 TaxID=1307926 RepID=A0ABT1CJZ1_9PROT|nr:hypothetical protein [Asaia lannensis]MCO6160319.1 hypothetical protein [Asaia lannensis NBRC 102526]GBQ94942.1 hypothetical protein AA102526_0271 [Asaia lannensis NBRC 102526]